MDPAPKENKHPLFGDLPLSTSGPLDCALTGPALLRNPYFNKGSAFTSQEREAFELHGLLPPNVTTLEEQVKRAYQQYSSRSSDLAKNTFMNSMRAQNEVLFYKLIEDHLKEMFPIIYTPTEGEAIADFSRLFRRPEGCYLNIDDKSRVDRDIKRWGEGKDIDLIVVSDGEQILGIGDQGIGGILISVAKLMLYTICAGINPTRTLPVVLDCGTNNKRLLGDELYLGLRKNRVRGREYDDFVESFVKACHTHYPSAYLHFEDFGLTNARRILDKYSPDLACFNDDIQGTGCIALAGIQAAMKITNNSLKDIRVLMFGAGTAGTGIADQIRDAIALESDKSKEDAAEQIWCIDKIGLLTCAKIDKLTEAQKSYARKDTEINEDTKKPANPLQKADALENLIRQIKPHVLIGTSTVPGAFTKRAVKEMAKHVQRPIIFPLSNPTKLHEAAPKDLFEWTDGKVLAATGSPFQPVKWKGKSYDIAECNNSTVFPGIGLGAILSRTKLLTPSMIVSATSAVASRSPMLSDPTAPLLPDVTDVREVSVAIAKAVIRTAVKEGLARAPEGDEIPEDDGVLEDWIREQMWDARYRTLRRVEKEGAGLMARGEAGTGRSH